MTKSSWNYFARGSRPASVISAPAQTVRARLGRVVGFLGLVVTCGVLINPAQADTVITNNSAPQLIAAINSGGGHITLAFNGTITVTNTLEISYNTWIDASTNSVTIAGAGSQRVFNVPAGLIFGLTNVTISGGKSAGTNGTAGAAGTPGGNVGGNGTAAGNGVPGMGGALLNDGTAYLVGCSFLNNSASGGNGGTGGNGGNGSFGGGNGGNGGNGAVAYGGAIYNTGSLLLTNCTFTGNSVTAGSGGVGGAAGSGASVSIPGNGGLGGAAGGASVYNLGSASVINCLFNQNTATAGSTAIAGTQSTGNLGLNGSAGGSAMGGGFCNLATAQFVNCTFYADQATGGTGGAGGPGRFQGGNGGNGGNALGGALYSSGTIGITNCTFSSSAANAGTNGAAGSGGTSGSAGSSIGDNLANSGGTLYLKNTILAAGVHSRNSSSGITDAGNNLSSDATPAFTKPTSSNNLDPKLQPLDNYGGPTLTMALLRLSPAVDRGENLGYPLFDQRGAPRPVNTFSNYFDIGAYEFGTNFTISGQIAFGTNQNLVVQVYATNSVGLVQSTTTGANGIYSFNNLLPDTYVITPLPIGLFSPTNYSISVGPNRLNANFSILSGGRLTLAPVARTNRAQLALSFALLPNQLYRIQHSTNLLLWQNLFSTNSGSTGLLSITNSSTNFTRDFFRAVTP